MVVQHNMTAVNANRYFGINNSKLAKSLEKLSSGYSINRAGDNAAGLAVSEKMRSQIAGINQGVKNAQDGISMVQTFEGALTETHSILQRMKTLADQSANGTYDDPIDRNAIEQEFLQLNDELNQIADTDYNGVIVLNGGVMADGLKAVGDKFDYANKADQVAQAQAEALAAAQKAANENITKAQSAYDAAASAFAKSPYDLSENGSAPEWNTVDNNSYDKKAADKLWTDAKLKGDTTKGDSDATKMEVTFKFDGTNWTVDSAKTNASNQTDFGDVTTDVKTALGTITASSTTDATGDGGFYFTITDADTNAHVINTVVDMSKAKADDTVTLVFTNETPTTMAPTNVGAKADSAKVNVTTTGTDHIQEAVVTENSVELTDEEMDDTTLKILEALDGISVQASYVAAQAGAKSIKIGYYDENGVLQGQDVTLAGGAVTLKDAAGNTLTDKDGNDLTVYAKFDSQKLTISLNDTSGGAAAAGTKLAEIGFADLGGAGEVGTSEVVLDFAAYAYEEGAGSYNVTPGDNKKLGTSTDAKAAMEAAKKALDEAKASVPQTYDDLEEAYKVSKSDAFDKSEAQLTYKDHIVLQVGARTKDAVDFTFQYQSTAMGDLKADLNCTAEGLGTNKLTLSTQEDANYAIDKIDQAINKVSMVRGTFGAIQNRLEHKIDNLNVTSENLTSAESRIRDTNMAEEMMNFTKNQILSQASQSMLAQANQLPQGVLSLLQ